MIRYARSVLHDFAHAGEEMAALAAGAAGPLHIGSVMGAVPQLLTRTLARFQTAQPRVRLSLQVDTSDQLIPALQRGDLDLVLGRLPGQFQDEDLLIEPLEGESMAVVARPRHPLFRRRGVTLSQLLAHAWVLHPIGSPMRRRVEQALQQAAVSAPPQILETSSILATTALLEASDMLAVVPLDVAEHYARHGMLRIVPVELPVPMAKLAIITRRHKEPSPALAAFLHALRATLAERS